MVFRTCREAINFFVIDGYLDHWPLGDLNEIFLIFELIVSDNKLAEVSLLNLPSCDGVTSRMISHNWFRKWLGAVRQQAIFYLGHCPSGFMSPYGITASQ